MGSAADFVFDFEEANQSTCQCADTVLSQRPALEALARRIELAARQTSELARQVYEDVTTLLSRATTDIKSSGALYSLASALADLGYDVCIRNALGGGSECFKSLRHSFILVRGTGDFSGMEFIVEPSLRQHFSIPHPSPEYDYVLSRTPDVFVGGSCRLVPVVQQLCALMADSFQRQGLPLPPWRKETAMLSKWMPHLSRIRDLRPRPCRALLATRALQSDASPQPQHGPSLPPQQQQQAHDSGSFSCHTTQVTTTRGPIAAVGPMVGAIPPPSELAWTLCAPGALEGDTAGAAIHCCPLTAVLGFDVGQELPVPVVTTRHKEEEIADGRGVGLTHGSYCPGESQCEEPGKSTSFLRRNRSILPYSDQDDTVDKLDECASPCAGPSPAEDTGSFFFTSEASCANSPVLMYDTLSLMGSPSVEINTPAEAASAAGGGGGSGGSASFYLRINGHHRPTATGMLPGPCPRTGLLSAKMMFESLLARTAQPQPPTPAAAAVGTVLIDMVDCCASFEDPWAHDLLSPPPAPPPPLVTEEGEKGRYCCLEIRPLVATAGVPHIQPVRLAAAAEESRQEVTAGGAQVGAASNGNSSTAAAAPARLSQRGRAAAAEWLPWGLPPNKRSVA